MTDDLDLLKKRFAELSRRAYDSNIYTFTPFLGLSEQDALNSVSRDLPAKFTLSGGAPGCERVMARFGDPEEFGYEEDYPIRLLKIAPKAPKFAEALTHRDYLGALMNLGIERETLGDIILRDGTAYLFAEEKISSFLTENFTRAKHTDLTVTLCDALPEGDLFRTEEIRIVAAGERLDGVIAKIYHISREEANALFRKKLVFIDGKLTENNSAIPKDGARISVRGFGRFIYRGFQSETKKGKLNLVIEKYV